MCTCSVIKDNGRIFTSVTTPSLLVQPVSQLSHGVITELQRALVFGGCQIISTASTRNASQPNSFLLCLSTAELLVSLGSCFSLWFGSSGWLLQQNRLDLFLFPAHTCLCVRPCWGHSRRTVGVMRSQTALNGLKQAAQINNSDFSSLTRSSIVWNVNSKLLNGTKMKTASEATSISDREHSVRGTFSPAD